MKKLLLFSVLALIINVCEAQVTVRSSGTKWFYHDADGDGIAGRGDSLKAKVAPVGYTLRPAVFDCNDNNALIFPLQTEKFNILDDNCNGLTDEGFVITTINNTGKNFNLQNKNYSAENWQWTQKGRDSLHKEIDVFAQPFCNNVLNLHPAGLMFTNGNSGMYANDTVLKGWAYPVSCNPPHFAAAQCLNNGACAGDDALCFAHSINWYAATLKFTYRYHLLLFASPNPYAQTWTEFSKYISAATYRNVKLGAITFGFECQHIKPPAWYANGYYFPRGAVDFVPKFNAYRDSCKKYFPNVPVLPFIGLIWAQQGDDYNWNKTVSASAKWTDGVTAYGQTGYIANRGRVTIVYTEYQAVDTVLKNRWWLDQYFNAKHKLFGTVPIIFATTGTQPKDIDQLGGTFLGCMQEEYMYICFQDHNATTREDSILETQYYRLRGMQLQSDSSKLATDVQIKMLTSNINIGAGKSGMVVTNNPYVVAHTNINNDGSRTMLILNFSPNDYPLFIKCDGKPVLNYTITGYSVDNLLNSFTTATKYSGNYGVGAKRKSISIVKFNSN